MHSTRQAPRSSTVHVRALVAAALVLGLVLAIAAVAWAAPSLSIDFGPSGPTNDATPTFGFTAEDGATVECSVDQGVPAFGSCTTAASHTATTLADGDYTFRVRATDAAEAQTTEERAFTVDTTPPSLSIDSGPSGATNDSTPSFAFTAEPGATVECSVDKGTPAYGPCSTGTSHTAASLTDGEWVFRVRATDAAGNAAVAAQTFFVDTAPPSLSIDSGPSGLTNDSTPSFGFTTGANSVECSIDDATPPFGECTSATTHDVGTPLSEGVHVFRVRAIDGVGNDAIQSRTFTVDTTPPSLSIAPGPTGGPSGPTNDTTPTFTFSTEAGSTVACAVDHGSGSPAYGSCSTGPSGTSHTVASLADGSWVFHVRATDAAGNQAETTRSFSVDTAPPSLSIDSGPSGPTNDPTPTFGFTAEAGATVACSVDDGTPAYGSCTSPPTSHTAASLADGPHHFRVRATDAAGNQSPEASRSFVVDTVAPAAPVVSGPSGSTNDPTPTFGFTAESGATKECSVDQGTPAYVPCAAPYTAAALTDDAWVFRVRATDAAGNQGPEASQSFVVDTVNPAVSVVSGPEGPTNDTTPTFTFSKEVGATVACAVDHGSGSPAYGSCSTGPSGTSHTTAALADGSWVFHVRATDAAGNQGFDSQDFEVDSAAPSLSIDSGPPAFTNDTTPSFGFTTDADSVECSIDEVTPPFGACTSATTHDVGTPLSEGAHTFRVRAIDEVGNDAIQSRTFTVDTTPPSLSIDFGPTGTTVDNTPLFGFTTDADSVTCSIDQGATAYGPCASATTHAATAPLADGAYTFRVRATDTAGNETTATRGFTVDTAPPASDPGSTTPDPTPPVVPPATPTPSAPRLLSPFPLVRIAGTLTPNGAHISRLTVRAPRGATVRVTVSPACGKKSRSSRRCRVLHAAGTVGGSTLIGFRGLRRTYRSGTVIVVRVWAAERIGKYTRFTIVSGKAPRRVDQCLVPGATRGSRCPSA